MNYRELRREIELGNYPIKESSRTKTRHFEKINTYGTEVFTAFDSLLEELGRVPTQREFTEIGYAGAKRYFTQGDNGQGKRIYLGRCNYTGKQIVEYFSWNDSQLRIDVIKRVARSYISYLVEHITKLQLEEMGYKVISFTEMDTIGGVDLVVINEREQLLYIHITKDNSWVGRSIRDKQFRKPQGFTRDFTNHLVLTYTMRESKNNEVVNGVPIFKEQYLMEEFKRAGERELDTVSEIEDSYLSRVMRWARVDNGLLEELKEEKL